MKTRVPSQITNEILELCQQIGSSEQPRFVVTRVPRDALPNDCFPNVQKCIDREGGRMHLGWAIWELPGVMVEAELHAVWERPVGEWVDLNPRPIKCDRILFLPHPDVAYDVNTPEKRLGNIRRAVCDRSEVRRFIEVCEEIFQLEEENSIGMEIRLGGAALRRMSELQMERLRLQTLITGGDVEIVGPDGSVAVVAPPQARQRDDNRRSAKRERRAKKDARRRNRGR